MKPMPVHRAGAAGPDAVRRSLLAAIPGLMLGAVARAQPPPTPRIASPCWCLTRPARRPTRWRASSPPS